MSSLIYLDHAAATPVDPQVFEAMRPYFTDNFYNPSALYKAAHDVRRQIEQARSSVAGVLGARPAEVFFAAGGSEANNLAIRGIMSRHSDARILISSIEHDSVSKMASRYNHGLIPVTEHGLIDVGVVPELIDDETVLVSLMYANNEIGTIQPVREVAGIINEVRKDRRTRGVQLPLYLHVDAAQAANYLDLQVARLGADLLSLNGGKIYGPKQSGALYVRAEIVLEPLIYGGGQERSLRSGTENVPGIIGFARALEIAQAMRPDEARRLQQIQRHFIDEINFKIPEAAINGSRKHRLPNNVHITIPGTDNERLIFALDEFGIMAAVGSACSASSDTPSHVLRACGLSDEAARSSLRFTMGRSTTIGDVDEVVKVLISLAKVSA